LNFFEFRRLTPHEDRVRSIANEDAVEAYRFSKILLDKEILKKANLIITSEIQFLTILEFYAFLNSIEDFIMVQNKVDNQIRKNLFYFIWDLSNNDKLKTMVKKSCIDAEKLNDFIDNRVLNYSKILNNNNGINAKFILKIIEYQTQLFLKILINEKLSFYNPFPQSIIDFSPIHLDILKTNMVKKVLTDFYSNKFIDTYDYLRKYLTSEYFNEPMMS
jgi:hypothetical protein